MNKLTNFRKFVFASIVTLFGVISSVNAQSLSGSETENDPYLITSADDWNNIFAKEANATTYWASDKYVRLDANISVSSMVGTSSNKYQGTFDGNWHTLTFNKGTEASRFNSDYCAPFRYN